MLLPLLLNLGMFGAALGGSSAPSKKAKPRPKSHWADDVAKRANELAERDPSRTLSRAERKKQEKLAARGIILRGPEPSVEYAPELAALKAPVFDDIELKIPTKEDDLDEMLVLLVSEP